MDPSPSLNIAFLMSSLGLVRGGMETIAARLAEGLVQRGHRIAVVAGRWPGSRMPRDLAALPVEWLRIPCLPSDFPFLRRLAERRPGMPLKARSLSFIYACQLDRRVRRLMAAADVTLTFFDYETVSFSRLRQKRRRPNVSYFPGMIDWQWLRNDCSVVRVAISSTIAQRCQDLSGFQIDGIVRPGVPQRWLEEPYIVRPQGRTLVFVGRLESNKGILEMVEIFEALSREHPDLRLRIIGDGPLRPELSTRLLRAGLSDQVACLGGLPPESVRQELQNADLFVLPSYYESFGIAILEAQAIGVPVVSSDIPAIREAAGDAARLIAPGKTAFWVETIRSLLADPQARTRMSRDGRERARHFTWRQVAEDMEKYLYLAVARQPL